MTFRAGRVAFLGAGILWAQAGPGPAGDTFLLSGGAVHTVSGGVIENGSVLVRDGKIIGVGRGLTAPEGVPVIDVTGRQVYPGMIDSASRLTQAADPGGDFLPAARVNGVTTLVAMPDTGKAELIPGMLSVNATSIYLRFPAIATMPVPPHERPDDDDEPTTAVEAAPLSYGDAKKAFNKEMAVLNRYFDAARKYRRAKQSNARRLKPDAGYDALMPVLDGAVPLFVSASREREIRDAIAFADRQKIHIVLEDPYEAYKVLPLIKAHDISVVLGPPNSLPIDRDDDYDRSLTTPAALLAAGIPFSIGTFSARLSRNLPYEAAAAVAFGLPHDEAYKAVSLNAARIFGMDKRLGSIDEGKAADLIVTDGDPLEATTTVAMVFVGGKQVNLETRQKKLADKYSVRP